MAFSMTHNVHLQTMCHLWPFLHLPPELFWNKPYSFRSTLSLAWKIFYTHQCLGLLCPMPMLPWLCSHAGTHHMWLTSKQSPSAGSKSSLENAASSERLVWISHELDTCAYNLQTLVTVCSTVTQGCRLLGTLQSCSCITWNMWPC